MKRFITILSMLLILTFGVMTFSSSVNAFTYDSSQDFFEADDVSFYQTSMQYFYTIPANSGDYVFKWNWSETNVGTSINQYISGDQGADDLWLYIGDDEFEGFIGDFSYTTGMSAFWGSDYESISSEVAEIYITESASDIIISMYISDYSEGYMSDVQTFGIENIFSLYAVDPGDEVPPTYTYSNAEIDTPYYDLITEAEIRAQLSATDPEEGDVTSRIQVYNDAYTSESKVVGGNYYIMYMVDDTSGNAAYLQVDINVVDDRKPYFIVVEDLTLQTGADISSFTVETTYSDGAVLDFSWYEGDAASSGITYLLDYIYPYDEYHKLWNFSASEWSESFAVDPTGNLFWNPESLTPGTYTETYTITDPSGNTASLTLNMEVLNNNAPIINGPDSIDLEYELPLEAILSSYTGTDVEDGTVEVTIKETAMGKDGANEWILPGLDGAMTLTLSAIDQYGKETTRVVTVTIVDTTPGVFKIDGIEVTNYTHTVNMSDTTTLQTLIDSIVFIDNYDGNISASIVVPALPSFTVPGTTNMNITCTDSSGNTATLVLQVDVVDDIKPVINGASKIVKGITATLTISDITAELTATDNVDGIISVELVSDGYTGNSGVLGSYLVQYKATDTAGNISYHDVRVWVVDNQAPAWVLNDFFVNLGANQSMERTELVSLLQASGMIGSDISYTVTFVSDEYTGNEEIAGAYQVVMNVVYEDGSEDSITVQLNVPEDPNDDDVIVVDPEDPMSGFDKAWLWVKTAWTDSVEWVKGAWQTVKGWGAWVKEEIWLPVKDFFTKPTTTDIPTYTTTETSSTTTQTTTNLPVTTTTTPPLNQV